MNIAKALKRKKKLTTEIEKLKGLIQSNNSYTLPNEPIYGINKLLGDLDTKTKELIDLKLKLATANIGINDKIYLMAELKGKVSTLKNVPTFESISYGSENREVVRKSVINQIDMDNMIVGLETEIENLQDSIDYYNQITNIEKYFKIKNLNFNTNRDEKMTLLTDNINSFINTTKLTSSCEEIVNILVDVITNFKDNNNIFVSQLPIGYYNDILYECNMYLTPKEIKKELENNKLVIIYNIEIINYEIKWRCFII